MLRFKAGDRHSPIAGSNVESPYNLSPVGQDVQGLLSPKLAQRKIARSPFKVGGSVVSKTRHPAVVNVMLVLRSIKVF